MGEAARTNGRRLDSWKEIATFFGRDERTVRRWEKENSLPIHRVPGSAKGRVFAYEDELSQWLRTPQAVANDNSSADAVQTKTPRTVGEPRRRRWGTAGKWAIGLAVCGLLVCGTLVFSKNRGFAVHASGAGSHGTRAANSNAEDFYLKGRYYWNKRTPDDLTKAVDLFTQAIVQDPNYAPAYVGLADCYNLLREFSVMPPAEAFPRARAAAQKAVELDPGSAEAHNSLAFALFWGYMDVAGAEREYRRALALEPNNVRGRPMHV
jgi:tetratricopeptide (TPR) repeat protein